MCMIGVAVHPRQILRKAPRLLPSVFMEILTYAYGGSGTPGIGRDHALKLVKKYPDGSFDAVSQDIGHAPHLIHMPYTGRGGEGDAFSYFAIFNKSGPAGGNIELFGREVEANRSTPSAQSVVTAPHLPAAGGTNPPLSGGPITVYDYTGGATAVTMNNVHTAQ